MTVTINGPANAASSGGGSGTVTHTAGALTANQVVIGNGTDDLKTLGSLGTTTTVLHGNAAGAPTYGAVAIATDVSGLGTGVATFLATPSSANLSAALTDETGTGAAVFANTPTLVTPEVGAATGTSLALTGGALTDTQAVAATSIDGLVLATSATATSGNQKYSSAARFTGSGWKTAAGGAAQSVDWRVEVRPIQDTTNPQSILVFLSSVNGGAWTDRAAFTTDNANNAYSGFYTQNLRIDAVTYAGSGNRVTFATQANPLSAGAGSFYWDQNNGMATLSIWTVAGYGFTTSIANAPHTGMTYGGSVGNIRFGYAAANPPVAQTLSVQNASGTNIAGAVWTQVESLATGNAKGGGFQWQLGTVGASGTTLQTAATKLDLGATTDDTLTFADAVNIAFNTTTGTKIGTGTTQKLGFYNATPIAQGASVADPSGGAIIDAEARTAIIAVITRLEALGLIATV